MKRILLLVTIILLFSCNREYRVARITYLDDTTKKVEIQWNDSTLNDTTFIIENAPHDSIILVQLKIIEDSLRIIYIVDSIAEFKQDSTNFRKITRKINGGYNGWEDRYKKWLNNREILKEYGDTIFY